MRPSTVGPVDLHRGRRFHLARLFEQVEHAVEAGQAVLKFGRTLGQHGERPEQHQQVDEEHHQVAERQVALDHAPAAVQEQQRAGQRDQHFPDDFDRRASTTRRTAPAGP